MAAAEGLVPILALISVVGLVAFIIATEKKRWLDTSDALFVYVFTFFASLFTTVLSEKYNMLTYTWIGVGVLVAMIAYGLRLALKS